jgi:hypothetical protein
MNPESGRPTIRVWVLAAGVLLVGTTLSAILATAILDALIQRPAGGGSVTTIIPGFVYAAATVMKVCLVGGVVSAGVTLMVGVFGSHARPESALAADNSRLPPWGIASVALPAVTPLAGAITVVLVQQITSEVLSLRDFTYVSRTAVFVTLALLSAGDITAILSLTKLERPRLLAVLGLLVNGLLIVLFWHLRFYAIGFDQDAWAPH